MALMIKKYSSLRLVTLVSLPCMVIYCPSALAEIQTIAANTTSQLSASKAYNKNNKVLVPSLVGVLINGEEQGSTEALYDSASDPERDEQKDCYFLSINDLSELTKASFTVVDNQAGYDVSTPIGKVQLSADQIYSYQGQDYVSLSTLKKLGITAVYSQPDLAIMLNMGWRPAQISVPKANNERNTLPIDYRSSQAGLLGLSFNSTLSTSQSNNTSRDNASNNNDNDTTSTSRQIYADLGAYGYGLGGVWGIKAIGYDFASSNDLIEDKTGKVSANDSFVRNALNGFSYLPSDWDNWGVDNLYWAKSGKQLATRIGINRPNALSQGAQTTGTEFTGAMVAYSNRDIGRHLSYFDQDSRSLLQNTNQDYQHLTGIGEAGGVAELRISGRALARVQIGLDGRYEFLNLDVSQLTLTDNLVEVAIYAYPLARQPLEVRPIVLGKRRTNVATDELLIEAGIGASGNLVNSNSRYGFRDNNSGTAAHLYTEYGVNNRLAVRGGVNTNAQNLINDSKSVSWHTGVNYSLSPYSNFDFSYADSTIEQLWQAQLQYQRKKLLAYYQYQARQYDKAVLELPLLDNNRIDRLNDQRHQLLLNYSPSDRTNLSLSQYYDQMAIETDLDNYYAYASINHRFNDALNAGANWNSLDDRYSYRINWQDIYRNRTANDGKSNTIGLSGDNTSDTLSVRHQFDYRTSFGQSVSALHDSSRLLNQGDINYRFDGFNLFGADADARSIGTSSIDNLVSIGYSLFDGQVGWLADWQLTHRNGINFSLGYKHRYVDAIPSGRYTDLIDDSSFTNERELPAWTQNNYLFAKLSFDMFKPPKQNLKFGQYPRQEAGSVVVDLTHHVDSPIDNETLSFQLDNQHVQASLLGTQANHSQYLISNIKAGDYTLSMDATNLPLEYSASELQTPRIRVSNYAPTSVPIKLEKTYGISGKLTTAEEGIVIDIYQKDKLIQSVTTGSYGYFQIFGLAPDTYTLNSKGYEAQSIEITNDFVLKIALKPLTSSAVP